METGETDRRSSQGNCGTRKRRCRSRRPACLAIFDTAPTSNRLLGSTLHSGFSSFHFWIDEFFVVHRWIEPIIRSFLLQNLDDLINVLLIHQNRFFSRFVASENRGNRHAPRALAGNTPIRTVGNHRSESLARRLWNHLDILQSA